MASYIDIQNWLRRSIREGRWRAGDKLPSEAQLSSQFEVSRMTVNRALRELQLDGLIRREQGRGSFVAPLERVAANLVLRDLHLDVNERGHHHVADVLCLRREAASEQVAHALKLKAGVPVFFAELLHHEQGTALQLEQRWVKPSAAPGFLKQDFSQQTPTAYLLEVAPLVAAQYQIEALCLSAREAELLQASQGSAGLLLQRLSHGAKGPVSWAKLLHPAERFVLQGSFQT
jgi:GntR family transcriptional regulator, histidine utilization repressor